MKDTDKFRVFLVSFFDDNDVKQKDVAEAVGIDPKHLSDYKLGRKPLGLENRKAVANEIGVDYYSIVKSGDKLTDIELKHFKKIKEFKDKKLAYKLNSMLVEIEKNPDLYDKIVDKIEYLHWKATKKEKLAEPSASRDPKKRSRSA